MARIVTIEVFNFSELAEDVQTKLIQECQINNQKCWVNYIEDLEHLKEIPKENHIILDKEVFWDDNFDIKISGGFDEKYINRLCKKLCADKAIFSDYIDLQVEVLLKDIDHYYNNILHINEINIRVGEYLLPMNNNNRGIISSVITHVNDINNNLYIPEDYDDTTATELAHYIAKVLDKLLILLERRFNKVKVKLKKFISEDYEYYTSEQCARELLEDEEYLIDGRVFNG